MVQKQTYAQNWPAYNEAQSKEKALFMELLADLCRGVQDREQKLGRPTLSLGDMIYCATFKVFSLYSGRRFVTDMEIAREKGYIAQTPHFNSVFNYLRKPVITPILLGMIEKTSLPLKEVEVDFAVDSSGFSTSRYGRWFDYMHGSERRYRKWIKAHVMCGVKTNIVTSVVVTEGSANDSPFFRPLVEKTVQNFDIGDVSADKAYLSRENLETVGKYDGMPFIPFKSNTVGNKKGSPMWRQMWNYYQLNRERFLERYHRRSNVETVFHMVKAKFGGSVRSKNETAQMNEVLCKILCHNICVVIQEMHETRTSLTETFSNNISKSI